MKLHFLTFCFRPLGQKNVSTRKHFQVNTFFIFNIISFKAVIVFLFLIFLIKLFFAENAQRSKRPVTNKKYFQDNAFQEYCCCFFFILSLLKKQLEKLSKPFYFLCDKLLSSTYGLDFHVKLCLFCCLWFHAIIEENKRLIFPNTVLQKWKKKLK